jgi:hypothetical protein
MRIHISRRYAWRGRAGGVVGCQARGVKEVGSWLRVDFLRRSMATYYVVSFGPDLTHQRADPLAPPSALLQRHEMTNRV